MWCGNGLNAVLDILAEITAHYLAEEIENTRNKVESLRASLLGTPAAASTGLHHARGGGHALMHVLREILLTPTSQAHPARSSYAVDLPLAQHIPKSRSMVCDEEAEPVYYLPVENMCMPIDLSMGYRVQT
jgi:hypothetical protein